MITTALIHGLPAPKIITKEMVNGMHCGSVIMDLASENGGNCELTKPGKIISSGYKTTQYNIPLYRKYRPKNKAKRAEDFIKNSFFLDIHRWRSKAEIDEELEIMHDTINKF